MLPREDSVEWLAAVANWQELKSDPGAIYDKEVHIDAADIAPTVTWGTSPQDTAPITGVIPDPAECDDPARRAGMVRALEHMGLSDRVVFYIHIHMYMHIHIHIRIRIHIHIRIRIHIHIHMYRCVLSSTWASRTAWASFSRR